MIFCSAGVTTVGCQTKPEESYTAFPVQRPIGRRATGERIRCSSMGQISWGNVGGLTCAVADVRKSGGYLESKGTIAEDHKLSRRALFHFEVLTDVWSAFGPRDFNPV